MPFKLLIQAANNTGNLIPAKQEWEEEVIIGRGEASGLRLPDQRKVISSRHAKISRQGNDYVLVDIGSINGTFLNGTRIQVGAPLPLAAHDQIGIGTYVLEFVPVEASPWSGEEDSDATLCVMPPQESLDAIVDRLKMRYAELISGPANEDEREAELVKFLEEATSGLGKEKSKELLAKVERAFLPGDEPSEKPQEEESIASPVVLDRPVDLKPGPSPAISQQTFACSNLSEREEEVLTVLLNFVLDSLKGRRKFQKELEVEVTRIFGKERNPIKWAETSQEIRTYLFESAESNTQFPQIIKELQQVLEDLSLHPVGLMAGFRECVRFLLKQLDPSTLEMESKNKRKAVGSRLLPMRLLGSHPTWEYFKEKHRQLREEEIKTFHRLLGPEFAKGYLRAYQQTKSS
ncbi:MAG: type VI secretion system-associated FHA domain protein [Nitrospirales bacterium]